MGMWCGGTRGWVVGLVCWTGDCVGVSLGGCGVRLVVWFCSDLIDFVMELGSDVSPLFAEKCVACNLSFLFSHLPSPISLLRLPLASPSRVSLSIPYFTPHMNFPRQVSTTLAHTPRSTGPFPHEYTPEGCCHGGSGVYADSGEARLGL
jgi:hypothetical protein